MTTLFLPLRLMMMMLVSYRSPLPTILVQVPSLDVDNA